MKSIVGRALQLVLARVFEYVKALRDVLKLKNDYCSLVEQVFKGNIKKG